MKAVFPSSAPPAASTVRHWLKPKPNLPDLDNAYMLAIALGVRPAWLAFNEGAMHELTELPPSQRRPYQDAPRRGKKAG